MRWKANRLVENRVFFVQREECRIIPAVTTRLLRIAVMLIAVALGASVGRAATPPEAVFERLGTAASPDESPAVRSWRTVSHVVIQKTNGKGRHETDAVIEAWREENGAVRRRAVRLVQDGKDRTAKLQEKLDEAAEKETPAAKNEPDREKGPTAEFVPPDAAHREAYRFVPLPPGPSGEARCRIVPASGHEKDDGILEGVIAWDPTTLDPLFLEGDLLQPPKPLKTFHVRVEYRRAGSLLYPARILTRGLASVLLIKRRFEAEIRYESLVTSDEGAAPRGEETSP